MKPPPKRGPVFERGPGDTFSDHSSCPVCGSSALLDITSTNHGTVWFCPIEDAHPGGVLLYPDGRFRRLFQPSGTITSPIKGEAET